MWCAPSTPWIQGRLLALLPHAWLAARLQARRAVVCWVACRLSPLVFAVRSRVWCIVRHAWQD